MALLLVLGCESSVAPDTHSVEQELASQIDRIEGEDDMLIVAHDKGLPAWEFSRSGTLQSGLNWIHISSEEFDDFYDGHVKGKLGEDVFTLDSDCEASRGGLLNCVVKLLDYCDGVVIVTFEDVRSPFELDTFVEGYNNILDDQGETMMYDACDSPDGMQQAAINELAIDSKSK